MAWTVDQRPKEEAELFTMTPYICARPLRVAEPLETFGSPQVGMPHARHLDREL